MKDDITTSARYRNLLENVHWSYSFRIARDFEPKGDVHNDQAIRICTIGVDARKIQFLKILL